MVNLSLLENIPYPGGGVGGGGEYFLENNTLRLGGIYFYTGLNYRFNHVRQKPANSAK